MRKMRKQLPLHKLLLLVRNPFTPEVELFSRSLLLVTINSTSMSNSKLDLLYWHSQASIHPSQSELARRREKSQKKSGPSGSVQGHLRPISRDLHASKPNACSWSNATELPAKTAPTRKKSLISPAALVIFTKLPSARYLNVLALMLEKEISASTSSTYVSSHYSKVQ
jgi:hypothetical protein